MAITLYELTVPTYQQTLGAVAGFLDKGLAYCIESHIDPHDVVETRLFDDMLPFRFQIESVCHHSMGAIEALHSGQFSPQGKTVPLDYVGLQKLVADTRAALAEIKPADIDALEGKDVAFVFRDRTVPFVAERFVQSFSLPNFYFHAATAYDILRNKGVPLGKRDFMGQLRIKA